MKILDNYIKQLIENSTPQEPAWNIEKIRAGKPNTWNYIDGCMIKALITFYDITKDERYLQFADEFIDYFVQEDGSIKYYDPKEYNLDNVNAGKTLYRLYDLTGKENTEKPWIPFILSSLDSLVQKKETSGTKKFIQTKSGWTVFIWLSRSICSMNFLFVTAMPAWTASDSSRMYANSCAVNETDCTTTHMILPERCSGAIK